MSINNTITLCIIITLISVFIYLMLSYRHKNLYTNKFNLDDIYYFIFENNKYYLTIYMFNEQEIVMNIEINDTVYEETFELSEKETLLKELHSINSEEDIKKTTILLRELQTIN